MSVADLGLGVTKAVGVKQIVTVVISHNLTCINSHYPHDKGMLVELKGKGWKATQSPQMWTIN